MKRTKTKPANIETLYQTLGNALAPTTIEIAKKYLAIKQPMTRLTSWIKQQSERNKKGLLTLDEAGELDRAVRFDALFSSLQFKSIQLMARANTK